MEFCERLKSLRIKRGMTQKELSKQLKVSIVSIGHWESGEKNPSMSAIISLAKIFGVTTDYLLGVSIDCTDDEVVLTQNEMSLLTNYRTLDKHGKKAVIAICKIEKSRVESEKSDQITELNMVEIQKKPSRFIPRYSTPSAAGYSVPLDGDDFEMILVDENVPADADFAVGIQGDSMYPYIQDGDTVYVKKDCELSIGDIGIFSVDGSMYCKQYYVDEEGNLTLVSANPELRDTNVHVSANSDSFVKCYGKVLLDHRVELPDYLFE